jgi:glycosyltransferase involved in cell wall biosynthesis
VELTASGGLRTPDLRPVPGGSLSVLHVVESLGSGVAATLEDYLRSTPEHRHLVLAWRREGAQIGDELERLATRVIPLPHGRLAQLRAVRHWVRELRPDVIHAHSSYAGLYARLLGTPARSLVYTPHAYAFERKDVPGLVRGAFWGIEAVLSLRGGWVAAVGPREAYLSLLLPGRQTVVYVPNTVRLVPPGPRARAEGGVSALEVVTVGRITPQKAPGFLLGVVAAARSRGLPLRWTWIGGGDPGEERALRDAGVEVTGWLSRSGSLERLAAADIYVHTAAWEGSPLTILEAAVLGLPVVARRNPALQALGLPVLCDTPEALAAELGRLLDDGQRARLSAQGMELLERHHPDSQRQALRLVYAMASGGIAAGTGTPQRGIAS